MKQNCLYYYSFFKSVSKRHTTCIFHHMSSLSQISDDMCIADSPTMTWDDNGGRLSPKCQRQRHENTMDTYILLHIISIKTMNLKALYAEFNESFKGKVFLCFSSNYMYIGYTLRIKKFNSNNLNFKFKWIFYHRYYLESLNIISICFASVGLWSSPLNYSSSRHFPNYFSVVIGSVLSRSKKKEKK